jgi:histidine triad (HIT) family protein
MSLDGTYEDNNPFALIIAGKLPAARLYEDADTLAFLDIQPQGEGHSLVISKWSRGRNILEIEREALHQVMDTVQKVAHGLRKALAPDGIHIAQFNGGDTGQSVFHLHVHVVPRWKDKPLGILKYFESGAVTDAARLEALAARIRPHIA